MRHVIRKSVAWICDKQCSKNAEIDTNIQGTQLKTAVILINTKDQPYGLLYNKTVTYVSNEDSNYFGHPLSWIRDFEVCLERL